uniref:Endonuclease/exonuclease/phosphatase domain-containing protein n=1 Tax=Poecilia reticulata TaxID=8081 RepID=A0A3P9PPL0_POERE
MPLFLVDSITAMAFFTGLSKKAIKQLQLLQNDIFDIIAQFNNRDMIIGGDFNCYLDPLLDRSSSQVASSLKSVSVIMSLNLVDIWRLQHPSDRKYSFFPPSHGHDNPKHMTQ